MNTVSGAPPGFSLMSHRRTGPYPAHPRVPYGTARPASRMSYETFRFPPPLPPPVSDWLGALASRFGAAQAQAPGFDDALLAADPAKVEFALDPASVRITGENTQQWNTHYSASGEVQVSAPGVDAQTVPVRYDVTLRNEDATPAQMRAIGIRNAQAGSRCSKASRPKFTAPAPSPGSTRRRSTRAASTPCPC